MKKLKALALLFAVFAITAGISASMTSRDVEAARCCWVMVCTSSPPIVCYEVCVPCP